jgi:uncharacterized protein YuzE
MSGTKVPEIRLTYDPEADALAIDLAPLSHAIGATKVARDAYAHLTPSGSVVSFEVLNASTHVPREALERLPTPVDWLTLPEAARESGLAVSTLRNRILAGRLRAQKRGRDWLVAGSEIATYLANRSPRGRRSPNERPLRNSGTRRSAPRRGALPR